MNQCPEITEFLGFRIGDTVLDLAEITVGSAKIKGFRMDEGRYVLAVMENDSERYVVQLKKVHPVETGNVAQLLPKSSRS